METRILAEYPKSPDEVAELAAQLERGCLLVGPTDTIWGLFASSGHLEKLRDLKKRESEKPFILFPGEPEDLERFVTLPSGSRRDQLFSLWRPTLTLIFPSRPEGPLPPLGYPTIGIRFPGLPALRALGSLLSRAGSGLFCTSANHSGAEVVKTANEAIKIFQGKVDIICSVEIPARGIPSTVVDLTRGVRLLRGTLSDTEQDQLCRVLI